MGFIAKSFLQDNKQLELAVGNYNKKIVKAKKKIEENPKDGLDKYFEDDDSSDNSDDSFEEGFGDSSAAKTMSGGGGDPTKLIDFELIKLLNYCHTLKSHRETEDY